MIGVIIVFFATLALQFIGNALAEPIEKKSMVFLLGFAFGLISMWLNLILIQI